MKYSLEGLNTVHEIKQYIFKSLADNKVGTLEIQEFQNIIRHQNFEEFLQTANEYIDMLNKMQEEQECTVTYIEGLDAERIEL